MRALFLILRIFTLYWLCCVYFHLSIRHWPEPDARAQNAGARHDLVPWHVRFRSCPTTRSCLKNNSVLRDAMCEGRQLSRDLMGRMRRGESFVWLRWGDGEMLKRYNRIVNGAHIRDRGKGRETPPSTSRASSTLHEQARPRHRALHEIHDCFDGALARIGLAVPVVQVDGRESPHGLTRRRG